MERMKFLVEPSGQLQMAGFAGQTILNSAERASSLAFNRSRIWRGDLNVEILVGATFPHTTLKIF